MLEKARQILINEAPETLPPELVAKTARTRLSELTADIALTKTSESEHFIKISGKALAPRVGSAELPWIAEFAGEASHSQMTIDIKATLAAEGKNAGTHVACASNLQDGFRSSMDHQLVCCGATCCGGAC